MTQPENTADALARAEELRQSAEQFIESAPTAPRTEDADATRPMSLAELLADDDRK